MSANELYDLFKDAGLVPIEIVTNGIIAMICFSGITLNMLLVYITVKSKALHSTCNILVALYAFSISFLLIGNSVPFFIFLFGINFISLQLCFYIQIIPLLFSSFAILLQLCIGIDRLFAVSFPIWYQMGGRFKLFKIFIAICCAKTVSVNIYYYHYGSSKHWEKYKIDGRLKLFKIFIALCCAKAVFVNVNFYYGSSKHWEKILCSLMA